ncbi:hypothetical protein [uncultured Paraglaciecola sp.]|uniref:hypothetical protein n=1 Tax=uncultured Paraglaciecola sp. TaxID=1765024 RepID=UPI0030D98217
MTQVGIANIVGTLLRFVDANVVIEYNQIWGGLTERYVVIDHQCTGFSLIATLSAILFVLPINWQKKITGVVIIIVFVQLENVVRISHLYYLVVNNSPSFDFYHLYLWQGVNFVYAIALFLITFKLLIPKEKNEII